MRRQAAEDDALKHPAALQVRAIADVVPTSARNCPTYLRLTFSKQL